MTASRFIWFNQICSGLTNGADTYADTRNVSPRRLPWKNLDEAEIQPARQLFADAGLEFRGMLWMPQGYQSGELTEKRDAEGRVTMLLPFDQWSLAGPDSPTRRRFEEISSAGLIIYTGCLESAKPKGVTWPNWVRRSTADYIRLGYSIAVDHAAQYKASVPEDKWKVAALEGLAKRTWTAVEGAGSLGSVEALDAAGVKGWIVEESAAAPPEMTGSKMSPSTILSVQRCAQAARSGMDIEPIMLCRTPEAMAWAHAEGWSVLADLNTLNACGIPLTQWGRAVA